MPEDDEDLDEEEGERLQEEMEADYEMGSILRERVIPRAVAWFTGAPRPPPRPSSQVSGSASTVPISPTTRLSECPSLNKEPYSYQPEERWTPIDKGGKRVRLLRSRTPCSYIDR